MVKPIKMLFGRQTHAGTRNHVLDGDVYGRHLVNTVEQRMLDDDAGCCYHYRSNHYWTSGSWVKVQSHSCFWIKI